MRIERTLLQRIFALVIWPLSAIAASDTVVISQVYGGAGCGTAGCSTFKNDYIELFNRGTSAQSLSGWSVQYAAATGTSWQVTSLPSVTLQPGQYLLIAEGSGPNGVTNLPTADVTGSIALSATVAKIALVSATTALTGACPAGAPIVDFVGYGTTANCFETAAAPAPSTTTADLRGLAGCADTDNNQSDFTTGAPLPRNSATSLNVCSGAPSALSISTAANLPNAIVGSSYNLTLSATGGSGSGYQFTLDAGSTLPTGLMLASNGAISGVATVASSTPYSFAVTVTDSAAATATKAFQLTVTFQTCTPTQTIMAIQGSGIMSPLAGSTVTTSGIVTGTLSNGFFIQDPLGDGDPNTSDGIFVFTSNTPSAAATVGNLVCVAGTVQEFKSSSAPAGDPTQTEISSVTSYVATSFANPLPAPIVLAPSMLTPGGGVFQLEKYEGMRVQVNSLTVVGPTLGDLNETNATSSSTGEFYGVFPGYPRPLREPGVEAPDILPAGAPAGVPFWDANSEVIAVDTGAQPGSVKIDVAFGATVSNIVGPLGVLFRTYAIDTDPANPPVVQNGSRTFTAVPVPGAGELTIAAMNLERFYDTANDSATSDVVLTTTAFNNRLNKASLAIRQVMRYPDILGVEEMENLTTLQALAAKVNADAAAAGDPNPNYQAFLVEGNDVGGIDSGFLVKSTKVNVSRVTQYGKTDLFAFDGSLLNDRPPLVLIASITKPGSDVGLNVTVIVNHLRSLSGIDGSDGDRIRRKREAQAEYLANLIRGFVTSSPGVNIISVGDYNAFQFNDGYADVMGVIKGTPAPANEVVVPGPVITMPPLTDLVETSFIPADQRYSFMFDGNGQVLDHILVTPNMLARTTRASFGRYDVDFPDSYRNDPNRPERISDHDGIIGYFRLPDVVNSTGRLHVSASGLSYNRASQQYSGTITVTNVSAQTITGTISVLFSSIAPSGTTVPNATGSFEGQPYLTAPATSLAPGQSTSFAVKYSYPTLQVISPVMVPYLGVF